MIDSEIVVSTFLKNKAPKLITNVNLSLYINLHNFFHKKPFMRFTVKSNDVAVFLYNRYSQLYTHRHMIPTLSSD